MDTNVAMSLLSLPPDLIPRVVMCPRSALALACTCQQLHTMVRRDYFTIDFENNTFMSDYFTISMNDHGYSAEWQYTRYALYDCDSNFTLMFDICWLKYVIADVRVYKFVSGPPQIGDEIMYPDSDHEYENWLVSMTTTERLLSPGTIYDEIQTSYAVYRQVDFCAQKTDTCAQAVNSSRGKNKHSWTSHLQIPRCFPSAKCA